MSVAIAYFIAGLSSVAFLTICFTSVYKILNRQRNEVYKAKEELLLHKNGYLEKRGSQEEITAKHMYDTSFDIYEHIRIAYNQELNKPVHLIFGSMMGFRKIY